MKKIVIKIEGMDCASDAVDIERSIKKIKGINNVTINYIMHNGFIGYEGTVTEKQIKDAVMKAGFKVKNITYKT